MDLTDSPELAAYRTAVRDWLTIQREHAPRVRGAGRLPDAERAAAWCAWQARLHAGGLVGVTWPQAHGGRGLGHAHQLVVNQELEALALPGVFDLVGVNMLGPTIIAHGSEEQKARRLPPLLAGREVWCQLFSEPGAGSDLAAMETRATPRPGGGWTLSGQKVWTTNAHHAAFGLMLACTDAGGARHKNLTMFVVPMTAPGVTVRPLRQLSGEARFNEVFFDGVEVDDDAVVGRVGGGWRVALDTLDHDRVAIALDAGRFGWRADDIAAALAEDPAAAADRGIQAEFGAIAAELIAVSCAGYRAVTRLEAGAGVDPVGALAKVSAIGAATRAGDLLADVLGPAALLDQDWGRLISDLPGLRSAGGTEEVVRTLVGERVLGLPREPRADRADPSDAGFP